VESRCKRKGVCVINGGLSVSGLQHIGRLRGEVSINDVVAKLLRKRGLDVKFYLTLYTVDPWKGKVEQLKRFPYDASKYVDWPLFKVPDPMGELSSWVERYWLDFGPYLSSFAESVEVVTTADMYKMDRMKDFIRRTIIARDRVREVLNKYRGARKYEEDWIPFEPICEGCGKVGHAKALDVDLDRWEVRYKCAYCGYEGTTSLTNGKLPWRVEWVGVWYTLGVDFEPYGKDHAMPGGSRDSAAELAREVYGVEPPEGLWYEWVGYAVGGRDLGDMGSSDFIGVTPREWLEVAEPEVLRFIYLFNEPTKRVVLSMENVPQYTDFFDRAERLYFGVEKPSPREESYLELMVKSYEFSYVGDPPDVPPVSFPYLHAVALSQVLPQDLEGDELLEAALKRLKSTGVLKVNSLDEFSVSRIKGRIVRARAWVRRYAPSHYRIKLLDVLPDRIKRSLNDVQREKLAKLLEEFKRVEVWNEDGVKRAMINIPRESRNVERQFFEAVYLIFFGEPQGPRIAPYLAMLDKEFVLNRIKEAIS